MIDKNVIRKAAEDIDIFEADLTEDYDRIVHPRRSGHLLPWVAVACMVLVAGMSITLLTKKEDCRVAHNHNRPDKVVLLAHNAGIEVANTKEDTENAIKTEQKVQTTSSKCITPPPHNIIQTDIIEDTVLVTTDNDNADAILYANDSQLDERAIQFRDRVRSHALVMMASFIQ